MRRIVIAGTTDVDVNRNFAVARYKRGGALDKSFDRDGKVTTDLFGSTDVALAIAVQSDGKIVVAGFTDDGGNRDFALVKYTSTGALDAMFSRDGIVTTDVFGGSDVADAPRSSPMAPSSSQGPLGSARRATSRS